MEFDIQEYMTNGVKNVVNNAIKATLKNPKEAVFVAKFALASQSASKRRAAAKAEGNHVPAFLISSITSSCNLHCAGCYSRANHACHDEEPQEQLSADSWDKIFAEADELGISFILLAGGEPLLRKDVIDKAAGHENILFPIFTNGVFLSDNYLELFDKHRNLLPVISIEGDKAATDNRRGEGIYERIIGSINKLHSKDVIYGVSVTVTTENMNQVYSRKFIDELVSMGCKAVIYVEYVSVSEETVHLAPGDEEREYMNSELMKLRSDVSEMVFVSFPGDEKTSGGCVAAGRGFFHINSKGGAEPCPFSPYSDISVSETSLKDALNSKLFRTLRDEGVLNEDHKGGCILFEKKEMVESILSK